MYVDDVGDYRFLGRGNVDFLKSGGYVLSTLELEDLIIEAHAFIAFTVISMPGQHISERILIVIIHNQTNDDGNVNRDDDGDDGKNDSRHGEKRQQKIIII